MVIVVALFFFYDYCWWCFYLFIIFLLLFFSISFVFQKFYDNRWPTVQAVPGSSPSGRSVSNIKRGSIAQSLSFMSTLSGYGKNSVEKYVKSQVICRSNTCSMTNSHLWKIYISDVFDGKKTISHCDRIDLFHDHNLGNMCFTLKI